ncbi:glycosyltransferase family 4 protein [Alicyclobacillus herbarius]|uniref:glycosyltransferase family 4 protein n=1 Tax=Alicyclobacillus herbarius TaxID=122960 RepID=UPI000405D664|nr:glycosyltransferase family 4 protein [Alicyclobacillus herbarius]
MRIIYVTSSFPYGPGEAFLLPELTYLRDAGHDLWLIPLFAKGDVVHSGAQAFLPQTLVWPKAKARLLLQGWVWLLQNPGLTVTTVQSVLSSRTFGMRLRNFYCLLLAAALASDYGSWEADLIHAHWLHYPSSFAMLLSTLTGLPWVATGHRNDILADNLLGEKLDSAGFVRFISESGLEAARALAPEANFRHACVLHMGVDVGQMRTPGEGQVPSGPPVLLCPARLSEVKGQRYLLEAARQVLQRGQRFSLWLAGDGPMRNELETRAKELGLAEVVRFLGVVDNETLKSWYVQGVVQAVVLPSLHEGIPVALMEAMSCGVPVIATAVGGTPELVRDGAGILVPPKDATSLADAMERILTDAQACAEMSAAASRVVAESFSIERIGPKLEELLGQHVRLTSGLYGDRLAPSDAAVRPAREEV